MQTVKSIVRVDFAEASRPWLDLRALFRVAQGKETAEVQSQPLVFLREADRQRVFLQMKALIVECEREAPTLESLMSAISTVRDLEAAVPFADATLIRFEVYRIDAFELPLRELTARIKDHFIKPTPFLPAATDLQVVLEETDPDGMTSHLQIGPMEPEQLNGQVLAYARTGLPDQFLFLGLAQTHASHGKIDATALEEMASRFTMWAEKTSSDVAAFVGS